MVVFRKKVEQWLDKSLNFSSHENTIILGSYQTKIVFLGSLFHPFLIPNSHELTEVP